MTASANDAPRGTPLDAERIAALLDGALDTDARAALLAELARSDDDVDALADVAAVLRELDDASDVVVAPDPIPAVSPIDRARARRRAFFRGPWALLAAAAIVVAVGLSWRGTLARRDVDPVLLVATLERTGGAAAATPAPIAWPTTRGPSTPVTERGRAVRIGAISTQLALAAHAGDSAAVSSLAADAASLLDDVPGSGPVSTRFAALGAPSSEAFDQRLRTAWRAALPLLDGDGALAGAWLATARAAVPRRDATVFRTISGATRRALVASAGEDETLRALAERVGQPPREPIEWGAIGRDIEALLVGLGR